MFCVSAEQPVDITCIASYVMDNSTEVCPIDPLKTADYNHDWVRLKEIQREKKRM